MICWRVVAHLTYCKSSSKEIASMRLGDKEGEGMRGGGVGGWGVGVEGWG